MYGRKLNSPMVVAHRSWWGAQSQMWVHSPGFALQQVKHLNPYTANKGECKCFTKPAKIKQISVLTVHLYCSYLLTASYRWTPKLQTASFWLFDQIWNNAERALASNENDPLPCVFYSLNAPHAFGLVPVNIWAGDIQGVSTNHFLKVDTSVYFFTNSSSNPLPKEFQYQDGFSLLELTQLNCPFFVHNICPEHFSHLWWSWDWNSHTWWCQCVTIQSLYNRFTTAITSVSYYSKHGILEAS